MGEDPDDGTCDGLLGWRVDSCTVEGVDVSGTALVILRHIPGNILKGNWRAVVYLNEEITPQQEEALLNVFTGKLGGPVADFAKLIGEVVAVEKVPITAKVEGGRGTIKIGDVVEAEMVPF